MGSHARSVLHLALAASGAFTQACGQYTLNPYATEAPTRIPKIAITSPAASEVADAAFTIKVAFEKVIVDDTWSLYYVSDATPSKGASIGTGLPVTARTIQWDTSQMPAGTYYVHGELKSLGGVVTASAPGSITVAHSGVAGNSAPTVRLITPNGGETLAVGETMSVSWTATDGDGDTVTYELESSSDNGATWEELASDLTDTAYSWTATEDMVKGPNWRLRVTATDADGAGASDASDLPFSVL